MPARPAPRTRRPLSRVPRAPAAMALVPALVALATALPAPAADIGAVAGPTERGALQVSLRQRVPGSDDRSWWRRVETPADWRPSETAVIVCDVWDLHHCRNAVERLGEFAPRIARLLDRVRSAGGTVIHAPSDCMKHYERHPARARVVDLVERGLPEGFVPPPADRAGWCSALPAEALVEYPLDQSLGGEDDEPAAHAAWAAELEARGCNPKMPWTMQSPLVPIDADRDWVSDDGAEVARVLAARGVRHVLLVGVHLNMCVLGRPFGLRRLREAGLDVALVRDLTDTMYDPAQWPWVDHFTGTERMIEHVERHVCPTVSSGQILGDGITFRSALDTRPTVALVIAEEEYGSHRTLTDFARRRLGGRFRVVEFHAAADDPHSIPGLERVGPADVLLLSARRRGLPPEQMKALRAFVAAGKPVIGVRTASHAWDPGPVPEGREAWPDFDREVFGIDYSGHFGNELRSELSVVPAAAGHPLLTGVPGGGTLPQSGSLYRIAAAEGTLVLATGSIPGEPAQPVLTCFTRPDGGPSIYTSVGHPDDVARPEVERVLVNAVHVAAGLEPPAALDERDPHDPALRWVSVRHEAGAFPRATGAARGATAAGVPLWARAVIVPTAAAAHDGFEIDLAGAGLRPEDVAAWFDGREARVTASDGGIVVAVPPMAATPNRAGVLALSLAGKARDAWPEVRAAARWRGRDGACPVDRWQVRVGAGGDTGFRDMPLPAMFGGPADSVTILE